MTEQREPEVEPTTDLGDDPTRRWAPADAAEPESPAEADAGIVEGDPIADAIDEGMPLAPADEAADEPAPTPAREDVEPVASPSTPIEPPTQALDIEPTTPVEVTPTRAIPLDEPEAAIFRDSLADATAEPVSEEAQKLAAERAARKEARDAALAAMAPAPVAVPEPVVVRERSNDKFFASLGLFLLRLVVAGIFAIRGYQMLGDLAATQEQFAQTLLAPYAQVMAVVTGVAHLLIALSLILGLLTRVAGAGIVAVAGGALALVWWGWWNPFVEGRPGFYGELELLLATVGLAFLLVGGGGWSIDRSIRSSRAKDKAARQLAA